MVSTSSLATLPSKPPGGGLLHGPFSRFDPFEGVASDPQSLHKYTYVHNDPVNGTDPTGLFGFFGGLGGLLGGLAGRLRGDLATVTAGLKTIDYLKNTILPAAAGAYQYGRALQLLPPLAREVRGLANDLNGVLPDFAIDQLKDQARAINAIPNRILVQGITTTALSALLTPFGTAAKIRFAGTIGVLGVNGYAFALSVQNGLKAIEVAAAVVGRDITAELNWAGTASITAKVITPFSSWEPARYVAAVRRAISSLKAGQLLDAKGDIDRLVDDLRADLGDAIVIRG